MAPHASSRRLATVTVPAPDLRPRPFLRHAEGEARGFWARGERWVAHRGVAVEVIPDATVDGDRFGATAEAARQVARRALVSSEIARAPRVQFYGGFSFRSDHHAAGVWADFPDGLFHLPEVELEGDGTGDAWLRVRAMVDAQAGDEIFQRLRRRAEALRAELASRADFTGRSEQVAGRATATERASWEAAVDASLGAI